MYQILNKSSLVLCLGLSVASVSIAEDVKLYQEGYVPSAEEMADRILMDTNVPTSNTIKTRSISFGVPTKDKPMKVKPINNAANGPARIGLPIKFDYDSNRLNSDSLIYLKQLGSMLNLDKMVNEKIMIEGHTDAKGSDIYNLKLSKRRSQAVKEYLISNYNIDPSRIQSSGKGESNPLPNKAINDPLNRRVEFFRI